MAVIAERSFNWFNRNRGYKLLEKDLTERIELLRDTYTIRPDSQRTRWRLPGGKGENAYALAGSPSLNLSRDLLWQSMRIGCDGNAGGILAADLQRERRNAVLPDLPQEMKNKIIEVDCPNLPGGFHGASVEEAEAMEHLWGGDLRRAVRRWLHHIELNDRQHELLLLYLSPGSHQVLAPTIMYMYKERYPAKPIYVITMLDSKDIVRQRFPALRQRIMQDGLCRGMIITDNRRNPEVNDHGITLLPSALSAGGWLGQFPLQMANTLGLIFAPETSVRYATISVWAESLAVKHLPASEVLDMARTDEERALLEERYYTWSNLVEEKISRGIKTLQANPEYQSIPLPSAPLGHLRSAVAVAPVRPDPDYTTLAGRIDDNMKVWKENTDPNLKINYASIGVPLTPESTVTSIAVVLLQPLADDGSGIDALARSETPKLLGDGQPTAEMPPEDEGDTPPIVTPPQRGRGRPRKGAEQ
jgi:hypothetical protein